MPSAAGEASTLAEYQTLLAYDDRLAAFVVKAVNTSKEAKRKAAIQRALALFVCVLLFGAYYFANECQWEWYTGLYFSWITLSTIGLGDYSAMNRCPGNSYGDIARWVLGVEICIHSNGSLSAHEPLFQTGADP